MDWTDIFRKITILTIGIFILQSIVTFAFTILRYKKDVDLSGKDFIKSIIRLVSSTGISLFCFLVIWELLGQPLSWKTPMLLPLFIILNCSQFLDFSHQWAKFYGKAIHLSDL